MVPMFYSKGACQVQYMARALTSGAGAGSAIALLLHAFDRADRDHHQLLERCLTPESWHFDLISLLLGIFIGCLVYPVLEALSAYRWLVLQAVLQRVAEPARPRGARATYRVL